MRVLCLGLILVAMPSLSRAAGDVAETIDSVQQRVVKIFGAGGIRNLNAYSTGVLISDKGHVLTVWNHVLDTSDLTIVLHDGRRFRADVLGAEPTLDLAVVQIQAGADETFPFIDLRSAARADSGSRVLAFSNMFKVATGDEPVTVQHGVIAARTRLRAQRGTFEIPYDSDLYLVDAITNNAGSEGGLLTLLNGRPVALIGRQLRNAETSTWINYGIPMTTLAPVAEQIVAGDYTARPQEQNTAEALPTFRPRDFGFILIPDVVQRTPGYIDRVLPDSAAARAGLQREDLVVFVDNRLVRSCRELKMELGRLDPGGTVEMVVRRDDELLTFELPIPRQSKTRDP